MNIASKRVKLCHSRLDGRPAASVWKRKRKQTHAAMAKNLTRWRRSSRGFSRESSFAHRKTTHTEWFDKTFSVVFSCFCFFRETHRHESRNDGFAAIKMIQVFVVHNLTPCSIQQSETWVLKKEREKPISCSASDAGREMISFIIIVNGVKLVRYFLWWLHKTIPNQLGGKWLGELLKCVCRDDVSGQNNRSWTLNK